MKEKSNYRDTLAALREHFGKEAINAGELAEYLGLSKPTVSDKIKSGELPGKKVGHTFVISLIQLAQWETR